MAYASHDTDHRSPRALGGVAYADMLPDRILVRPERSRGLVADDEHLLCAGTIRAGEQPAAAQRNPHRREVVGRHGIPLDRRIIRPSDATLHVEAPHIAVVAKRYLSGHGGRFDAG